jgi:IclR family mhp operon transcriptional activator
MIADELQTLKRGLEVLAFISQHGPVQLSEVMRATQLPRTTVTRIVATLTAEGYCLRVPNSRLYMVTQRVRSLAMGLNPAALVTIAAMPVFEALSQDIEWPVGLVTPRGSEMVVRLATDETTSLALLKARPGFLAPMMITATGIVYLALEDPLVGNRTIRAIKARPDFRQFYDDDADFDRLVDFARKNGFLQLEGRFPEGSLGMPILLRGQPVGGLMMRYIRAGNRREKILERYLSGHLRALSCERAGFGRSAAWRGRCARHGCRRGGCGHGRRRCRHRRCTPCGIGGSRRHQSRHLHGRRSGHGLFDGPAGRRRCLGQIRPWRRCQGNWERSPRPGIRSAGSGRCRSAGPGRGARGVHRFEFSPTGFRWGRDTARLGAGDPGAAGLSSPPSTRRPRDPAG